MAELVAATGGSPGDPCHDVPRIQTLAFSWIGLQALARTDRHPGALTADAAIASAIQNDRDAGNGVVKGRNGLVWARTNHPDDRPHGLHQAATQSGEVVAMVADELESSLIAVSTNAELLRGAGRDLSLGRE